LQANSQQLVSFGHLQWPLTQWCDFVHALLACCLRTLHDELLFTLPEMERFPRTHQLRKN
jgi:hypothetical protein